MKSQLSMKLGGQIGVVKGKEQSIWILDGDLGFPHQTGKGEDFPAKTMKQVEIEI